MHCHTENYGMNHHRLPGIAIKTLTGYKAGMMTAYPYP